ncbi:MULTISPECIES: ParB/RepB/Spo0J family partition protein [Cycloclasticus]|uniref:Probable chromosome-partitioning protein ParB n=1 Tax=Cycloclasticus pugetii TaxID=34068 RepID=A0AB33YZ74_9GAMM|nr:MULTISPECIES: ParB/RepB/Spo0J family partition protein [Cycloclasticus]ATI02223.1 ParB/RepB/Spo0J family partition protein [Cycloclasticus sp. PY97N]EPD12189.1 ParB-like nuclease domain family protein [Cycloclasticus pugetii]MBV1897915.1 ParB/RepB/Spo0J family partition protein [Cycloclasticus sp.]MDF1830157.1 ParB/RepB/Spo0J family partition protein [Cycloclasticus pugetii]
MSTKKRGLGRGLDALLSHPKVGGHAKETKKLPIDLLQRGKYQPRTEFDPVQLQELADSISAQGIIQPIVVRPISGNNYEILAGERRWRAAQLAGLQDVEVVINDVDDRAAIAISLIENIQRENLNILDESEALQRLINEFEMTHQQAADAVGRSRAAVSNLLRLLELGQEAKESLRAGKIEMGHGRALLALNESQQSTMVNKVVVGGLSVRATEAMVKRALKSGEEKKNALVKDPDVERLEQDISEKLGAKVKISHSSKGDGKIIIQFSSLDELEGVLGHFK